MDYRHTQHQVARGARPDAESAEELLLIKRVSEMRATYQIRLLAYLALKGGRDLIIEVRRDTRIHGSLAALCQEIPEVIKIERA